MTDKPTHTWLPATAQTLERWCPPPPANTHTAPHTRACASDVFLTGYLGEARYIWVGLGPTHTLRCWGG